MTLITTRSFYSQVKQEAKNCWITVLPMCIFYKTTEGICNIVESLLHDGIIKEDDYKVFCSKESADIKEPFLGTQYDRLELPLRKVNLFTFEVLPVNRHQSERTLRCAGVVELRPWQHTPNQSVHRNHPMSRKIQTCLPKRWRGTTRLHSYPSTRMNLKLNPMKEIYGYGCEGLNLPSRSKERLKADDQPILTRTKTVTAGMKS